MKYFLICCIFIFSLFLQTLFISLPFVLISIILLGVLYKKAWIFFVAFCMGILVDMLSFHTIGITSLYFITVLGVIFLYERKFEVQSIPFVASICFVGTYIYGYIFSSPYIFWQAMVAGFLAGSIFFLLHFFNAKQRIIVHQV